MSDIQQARRDRKMRRNVEGGRPFLAEKRGERGKLWEEMAKFGTEVSGVTAIVSYVFYSLRSG